MPITLRLLVVDDEPAQLELCSAVMEAHGFSVIKAGSPMQAISIAAQIGDKLDVAILDYQMPEMNGCCLAKHLRSICTGLRIVLHSGALEIPEAELKYVDAFIPKSTGVQAVVESLRSKEVVHRPENQNQAGEVDDVNLPDAVDISPDRPITGSPDSPTVLMSFNTFNR